MKTFKRINNFNDNLLSFDYGMLFFRISVSIQLMVVHGLKKIGIGTGTVETVPNPFNLTVEFNQFFAIAANLIFPLFVIIGWYTRLATIPILSVTLIGYFVVHWGDALLVSDIPFMYSVAFLFIAFCGAGKFSLDKIFRPN
jgi:putative oxidoreductase